MKHADRPQSPEQNPLLSMHSLLRGRYAIAVVLACVLAAGGAGIGYFAVRPMYASTAIIRIVPSLPKVLFESEENRALPMFDSFMQTQVSLVNSRRVLDMALQSKTWTDAGGTASPADYEQFTDALKVSQPKGSQLVFVTCESEEPARARAAAKSLLDSYMEIYGETDLVTDSQRFKVLDERSKAITAQMENISKQITQIANEFGTDNLSDTHMFEIERLQMIQVTLEQAKLDLAAAEAARAPQKDSKGTSASSLTVEQIAAVDPRMQQLVDERIRLRRVVDEHIAKLVRPEQSSAYRAAAEQLKSQEAEVERYVQVYRESASQNFGPAARNAPQGLLPILDPDRARKKVEQMQAMYDEAKTRTLDIGRKNLSIANLKAEKARVQESLDQTKSRIEQLNIESTISGRVSVLSEADIPMSPANSKRRIQASVLAGVAGAALGIGLTMLSGLYNRRIRDIADAEAVRPRLLGALPSLPDDLSSASDAMRNAANCVHNIRVLLQTQLVPDKTLALSITGGTSQTGKTSVALALGLSFAQAGTSTLIIDGDLLGRGLTRCTGAARKRQIGHILREHDFISDEQSRKAIDLANQEHLPLGQSLVKLGFISEDDLEEGLVLQRSVGLGLSDALRGEDIESCVADIGVENLKVLPLYENGAALRGQLSPSSVRILMEKLRGKYNVVLIDSGPVPGPNDSSIFATCADSVIMVVSRDDQALLVRHAFNHLELLNALPMGLIFNRARPEDIERSTFSTSALSSSGSPIDQTASEEGNGQLLVLPAEYSKFGPLAKAVWLSSHYPKVFAKSVTTKLRSRGDIKANG